MWSRVGLELNKDAEEKLRCQMLSVLFTRHMSFQMAGIVSAVIVLVTILKLGPLFQELPKVGNLWFIPERIYHHREGHSVVVS